MDRKMKLKILLNMGLDNSFFQLLNNFLLILNFILISP